MKKNMKTIELFSGTKSFSKVAKEYGCTTLTIDSDVKLEPDILVDILECPSHILTSIETDILWASPPCTTFSVASLRHYWKDGKPKNEKCLHGIAILEKTIEIIAHTKPRYWFIENPRGMMRKVIDPLFAKHGITDYVRHTVTYCQYGLTIMKPTDLWTNCKEWQPKPACKNGAPCHQRAGRGAKTGVQGIYNLEWEKARGGSAMARGVIPPALFQEIFENIK